MRLYLFSVFLLKKKKLTWGLTSFDQFIILFILTFYSANSIMFIDLVAASARVR